MILAGDIGGTKANLGLFEERGGKLARVEQAHLPSQKYSHAEDLIQDFLRRTSPKISAACFGIAGPVVENVVRTANIPWVVEGASLARMLGLSQVRLLNDLEATCYGVLVLGPSDVEQIHEGVGVPRATKVVIAAGTGLGEAVLFWEGARHVPSATEGGHSDFAPHTDEQIELWRFLKARNDYVSCETILSGRGFRSLHEFCAPGMRHPEFDDPNADPAPAITRMALDHSCPVCVKTLDLWTDIYGSEAGNLAIRNVALGGIYVAGGIGKKILPKLRDGRFAAAVADKEKMQGLLGRIPIYVVLDEYAPLNGAAHVAAGRA